MTTSHAPTSQAGTPKPLRRSADLPAARADRVGWGTLDLWAVDTVRVLAADAVQKVGNGHPGTAMSLAPVAYLLFQDVLRHDPGDDQWLGRDRFVLSCGHTSLTLYIQLFLAGYGLELSDLQALRTWGSATPGHPEHRHTAGVEITTGPLGQGFASAVGMAMAARRERGLLDPDPDVGDSIFDHHVYVLASDGDLMEGVTAEASSLAGHQQLGNLVAIYDQSHISIEDDTDISFSEDVPARYRAYGWDVHEVDWTAADPDGDCEGDAVVGGYVEDVDALAEAIEAAKADTARPSIIVLRTIIGWPAPTKQNTGAAHGSALGDQEVAAVKTLGQQRGEDPALRCAGVARAVDLVLAQDPGLEERLDQGQDSLVPDPCPHPAHQGRVVDLVEARLDVALQDPLIGAGGEHLDLGDGIPGPPAGSKPVRGGMEVRFKDRLQHQHQERLDHPVSDSGDPQPPVRARRLRDQLLPDR